MSVFNINNHLSNEDTIFSKKYVKESKLLKGDKHQPKEIDPFFIKQITLYLNDNLQLKKLDENEIKHFEEKVEKEKKNKRTILEIEDMNEEEFSLLDSKRISNISNVRKLSIEFLANLYNKGVESKSMTSTIDSNDSHLLEFKSGIKINPSNPYIYSINKLHPFSFFYGTKLLIYDNKKKNLIVPAPKFISSEDWMKEPDYSRKGIYKGIILDNKNGLVTVDPNINKKYAGLFKNIIWQLLKVPFGHHISLHIKMFQPRTLMERTTNIFSYANKYLIPASDPNISAMKRFKYVLTFAISGFYIPAQQLKPFNPFLGETFQGEFSNGAKVYLEQVTHNPLAMRFYIFYKNIYRITGYFAFSVVTENLGSNVYVVQKGPINVEFPKLNETITYNAPKIKFINVTSEKGRSNLLDGNIVFIDTKNNIKAVVKFFENKKKFDEMYGEIFPYKYPKNFKFNHDEEWEFAKKYKMNSKDKKIYCKIEGSWLGQLIVDKEILWDIDAQNPEFIRPVKSSLPSDGRYREDVIWLYRSFYCSKDENERLLYQDIAHEWKILMENFNREERKRRDIIKKKKKNK